MLSSCATNRGIVEFGVYRDAYVSAAETGQSILDRLAIAEREIHERISPPINATNIKFNPDEASYYSKAVDPPATAAFRRALRAVQMYNDALYGLASGQTAEAMAANISRLSAVGASAAGELGGLASTAVPGAAAGAATFTAAAAGVNATVKALEPLNAFALGFKTRAEFRERLLSEYHTIDQILKTTRDKTEVIFHALFATTVDDSIETFEDLEPITEADTGRVGELKDEKIKKIKQTRELLSNWVILLDGSRLALNQAVIAVEDTSNVGSVAGLIVTGTELGAAARAARMNLAETAN